MLPPWLARLAVRRPKRCVKLHSSEARTFVRDEVTPAEHVHGAARAEPERLFMACCSLVRCQSGEIDDLRLGTIRGEVFKSKV